MKDLTEISLQELQQQRESLLQAVRHEGEKPKNARFETVTRATFVAYDDNVFEAGFLLWL